MLSDEFFYTVANAASKRHIDGEWLLRVWYSESNLNAQTTNSIGCVGINQMCPGTGLKNTGLTADEYKALGETGQVPYAVGMLDGICKWYKRDPNNYWTSAAQIYAANMYPVSVKNGGSVIIRKSEDAASYAGNAGIDVEKKGYITVADMDRFLHKRVTGSDNGATYKGIVTRYRELTGTKPIPEKITWNQGGMFPLIGILAVGVGMFWLTTKSKPKMLT